MNMYDTLLEIKHSHNFLENTRLKWHRGEIELWLQSHHLLSFVEYEGTQAVCVMSMLQTSLPVLRIINTFMFDNRVTIENGGYVCNGYRCDGRLLIPVDSKVDKNVGVRCLYRSKRYTCAVQIEGVPDTRQETYLPAFGAANVAKAFAEYTLFQYIQQDPWMGSLGIKYSKDLWVYPKF